jgi:xanthine dehydrogenase accessory factor
MTCHSGGTLDIYIEPVLPKPHILIFGRSPIAQTLARLGRTIGYRISALAPGADREQFPDVDLLQTDSNFAKLNLDKFRIARETFIVVSTQGESDEEALEQAARSSAMYVAFVASKAKAQKVLEYLREAGVPAERVGQIRAPAGLDIHAASPEEIAVSILAEIIHLKGAAAKALAEPKKSTPTALNLQGLALPVLAQPPMTQPPPNEARDPVCGMFVNVSGAKYKSEHKGSDVHFCCAGCKQAFDRQPEKYTLSVSS